MDTHPVAMIRCTAACFGRVLGDQAPSTIGFALPALQSWCDKAPDLEEFSTYFRNGKVQAIDRHYRGEAERSED